MKRCAQNRRKKWLASRTWKLTVIMKMKFTTHTARKNRRIARIEGEMLWVCVNVFLWNRALTPALIHSHNEIYWLNKSWKKGVHMHTIASIHFIMSALSSFYDSDKNEKRIILTFFITSFVLSFVSFIFMLFIQKMVFLLSFSLFFNLQCSLCLKWSFLFAGRLKMTHKNCIRACNS